MALTRWVVRAPCASKRCERVEQFDGAVTVGIDIPLALSSGRERPERVAVALQIEVVGDELFAHEDVVGRIARDPHVAVRVVELRRERLAVARFVCVAEPWWFDEKRGRRSGPVGLRL